jgi:oligoendopeptidase F
MLNVYSFKRSALERRFEAFLSLLTLTLIIGVNYMTYAQSELPSRNDIEEIYKWQLTDIYPDESIWENDFNKVTTDLNKITSFQGKFTKDAKSFYEAVNAIFSTRKTYVKMAFYSGLARDLDLTDGKYQKMSDRISQLGSQLSAASAFFVPELLEMPESKLKQFIKEEPKLKQYEFLFLDLFRQKAHNLSSDEEKLLAQLNPIMEIPDDIYSILNDTELPFPTVKDDKGNEFRISHGRYRSAMFSNDRNLRRTVYKGTYEAYGMLQGTMAAILNGRIKTRIINAKIRKYSSALESALSPDNIPVDVFNNLIKTANDNLSTLHRWAELKKKYLKLDELHVYDTYASLFPGVQKQYSIEEARELIMKALAPLGEEYRHGLERCFNERWIDFYETKGKRSGAYSNGCGCGVHPYILMNWNNTLDDVFTLAHELGHNMHSYLTEMSQPFHYTNYTTFAAEIASTVNEALLLDYMIKNAATNEEKGALLEKYLINMQTTFFRQTRFAEFEKIIHERQEQGEMFDASDFTKLFGDLYKKYWGNAMTMDPEEGLSWERIPHLYHYDFYVFQYSTGFAASQALSQRIIDEGKPAVEAYLKFLRSGSSEYTIDMLRKAGVDMSKPDPIERTIKKTNNYLDDLEVLLKKM